jgi:hypothetical protein
LENFENIHDEQNSLGIPKDYFDNLTNNIMDKIAVEDFLNSLPKQNVYTVPENYFNKINIKLAQEINKKKSTFKFYKPLGIAAGLVAIIFFAYNLINRDVKPINEIVQQASKNNNTITIDSIQTITKLDVNNTINEASAQEIENYLSENEEEIEIDENKIDEQLVDNIIKSSMPNEQNDIKDIAEDMQTDDIM